ncbi:CBU_1789 family Dot/Icm type IV secretion system effector [Brooklawnia cerclae]|uniref:Sugar lactone lactonase YvrE n=1 Tax=Brooklawnia cerclae TaxID=349934 RepID=A0ABX0SMY2_9ACTN|nr:SMP-30/gluconolactonase/LRE family protein [Brooklawnia cerclae]NIH58395.1 sugar lactone lactonase YvrE [Brooklawnia cerclae]
MLTRDLWGNARQHTPDYDLLPLPAGTLVEGPLWLPLSGELLWVDIVERIVHIASLEGSGHRQWTLPAEVGFAVTADDGNVLVGQPDGIYHLDLASGRVAPVAHIAEARPGIRINDGKCDRAGRVWFGTMDLKETEPLGSVYRLTPMGAERVFDGVCTSNGLGWSPDDTRMYYTDSGVPRRIFTAEYDLERGEASAERVFLDAFYPGHPDGMCVDAEGCIWGARWQGAAVVRLSPEGEVLDVFHTPMLRPTSCAFVGPDLDELVVTTADWGENPGPHAGMILRFRPGTTGRAETPARLDLVPARP